MPRRSSPSAKITYFDREGVWRALRAFVAELAASHPEVERVVVFGSLARGGAVPGSDADLLVVLTESHEGFLARIPRYTPSSLPVGADVFPYTREELERMLAEGNAFVRRALDEGIEVYRREAEGNGDGAPE